MRKPKQEAHNLIKKELAEAFKSIKDEMTWSIAVVVDEDGG